MMELIGALVGTASAAIAIVGAGFAWYQARQAAQSVRYQRGSFNLSSIFQFLSGEYLDRPFRSTRPPIVDDEVATHLRTLKDKAKDLLKQDQGCDAWRKASEYKKGGWEEQLAREVSIALERLGIALCSGGIPVKILLPLAADEIIEDWPLCYPWIKSYREHRRAEHRRADGSSQPLFYRRHAEWLVLLCAEWMTKEFDGMESTRKMADMYEVLDEPQPALRERSKMLRVSLDPAARKEIEDALGKSLEGMGNDHAAATQNTAH